jgi:hypothetical protein
MDMLKVKKQTEYKDSYVYLIATYFGQKSTIIKAVYIIFKKEAMRCNVKHITLLMFWEILRVIVFSQ